MSKMKRRLALKDACLQFYTARTLPMPLDNEESIILVATDTLNNLAPKKNPLPVLPTTEGMDETAREYHLLECFSVLRKHGSKSELHYIQDSVERMINANALFCPFCGYDFLQEINRN